MPDVVVTVPQRLWVDWIDEGDAVGEPDTGVEWAFYLGGPKPRVAAGDRVYVVAFGLLRGYSPLVRIEDTERGFALVRRGGAVATTIDEEIRGFQGWRYRWWERSAEKPFRNWMTANVKPDALAAAAWRMQERVQAAIDRHIERELREALKDGA